MKNLNITVANKVATYRQRDGVIVCGNTDYTITFTFDDEWSSYTVKTARFKWNGTYRDVVFSGSTVTVPKIQNTDQVDVGVYAGDLHTTTPAKIPCTKSILCEEGTPGDPLPEVYGQLIQMINDGLVQGPQGIQGVPGIQGIPGEKGEKGDPFAIAKLYGSTVDMTEDLSNSAVPVGSFVMIVSGDADNGKLYVKGSKSFTYLTTMAGANGIQGPQGIQGAQGEQGPQGIQGEIGPVGPQGPQGEQGPVGPQGATGEQGPQGRTPVLTIQSGYWYVDGVCTDQPAQGKGDTGTGIHSIVKTATDGQIDTYTIYYTDGTNTTFNIKNGDPGPQGPEGPEGPQGPRGLQGYNGNGIASISKIQTNGLVDTYQIRYTAGNTMTFNVTNGNGISSITKIQTIGLVDTYRITFTGGSSTTFTVTNGARGVTGATGATGPEGPAGPQGDRGPEGEQGPVGPQGESAYEIASKYGEYENEQAWLDSLKGGPVGPRGPEGPRGESAYEIASKYATYASEKEWVESLNGYTHDPLRARFIELLNWYDGQNYEEIKITSFSHNLKSPYNVYAVGAKITKAHTFEWQFSKKPITVTLNGAIMELPMEEPYKGGTTISPTNYTSDEPATMTWTLTVTGERGETKSREVSIYFRHQVFTGASSSTDHTARLFTKLTSYLSNSHRSEFDANAGADEYIYYCVPDTFAEATFNRKGSPFIGGFKKVATGVPYTNGSATVTYTIYQSINTNLGSVTYEVE